MIMRTYPVNFLIEGKPCVVVGDGIEPGERIRLFKELVQAGLAEKLVGEEL